MREINASIPFDKRLWKQDLRGSVAHCQMLKAKGIIDAADADAILDGLAKIEAEYEAGGLVENLALEDIHMHVESRLAELIGPAAGRLHRSEEHTSELQSLMRISYAVFCLKKKKKTQTNREHKGSAI